MKNITLLVLSISTFYLVSCELAQDKTQEKKEINRTLPAQTADSVEVIYSEHAIIKAKLKAPRLVMKENGSDQYNEFEKGLAIDFFDKNGGKNARLTANYGYDNTSKRSRFVRDSVKIIMKDSTIYVTDELYIDDQKDTITNNGKFVKITRADGTLLQGYGFTSDTRMEKVRINRIFKSKVNVKDKSLNTKTN